MSGRVYKRGPGFVCIFCNRHYNGTCNQYIHLRRHIQEKPYNCLYCDFTAVCGTDLNLHTQNKHVNMSVSCDLCNATFRTTRNLRMHIIRAHNGRSGEFKCDICNRAFRLFSRLTAHKKTHTGEMPYKCKICGKAFAQMGNYNQHQRSHQKEKMQFECNVCGRQYQTRQYYKIHQQKYGGKCKPKTPKTGELDNELVKKEPGVNIVADVEEPRRKIGTVKRKGPGGSYPCDLCGREFNLLGTLITHRRTHTGEKPFKCETCGKGFAQKGNYNQHQRSHRKEKRFWCDLCGRGFLRKQHWKLHEEKWEGKCQPKRKKEGQPERRVRNGIVKKQLGVRIIPDMEEPRIPTPVGNQDVRIIMPEVEKQMGEPEAVVVKKGAAKRKDLGLGERRMSPWEQVIFIMQPEVTEGIGNPVGLEVKKLTPNAAEMNVKTENGEGLPVQVTVEGDQEVEVKTEEDQDLKGKLEVGNTEFVLGF